MLARESICDCIYMKGIQKLWRGRSSVYYATVCFMMGTLRLVATALVILQGNM